MSNFLLNCFEFDWIYLFYFGGDVDRGDSNEVQSANWYTFALELEITIHDIHSLEKGSVRTFIRSEYLNHPVYHATSQ
jgi:hypothetical protein